MVRTRRRVASYTTVGGSPQLRPSLGRRPSSSTCSTRSDMQHVQKQHHVDAFRMRHAREDRAGNVRFPQQVAEHPTQKQLSGTALRAGSALSAGRLHCAHRAQAEAADRFDQLLALLRIATAGGDRPDQASVNAPTMQAAAASSDCCGNSPAATPSASSWRKTSPNRRRPRIRAASTSLSTGSAIKA